VAKLYADWIDAFVIDDADAALQPDIEALGLRVHVTDTIMTDDESRARLAHDVLKVAGIPTGTG
jgi:LPPG:FO 2-phospho-L-lactate transferase